MNDGKGLVIPKERDGLQSRVRSPVCGALRLNPQPLVIALTPMTRSDLRGKFVAEENICHAVGDDDALERELTNDGLLPRVPSSQLDYGREVGISYVLNFGCACGDIASFIHNAVTVLLHLD